MYEYLPQRRYTPAQKSTPMLVKYTWPEKTEYSIIRKQIQRKHRPEGGTVLLSRSANHMLPFICLTGHTNMKAGTCLHVLSILLGPFTPWSPDTSHQIQCMCINRFCIKTDHSNEHIQTMEELDVLPFFCNTACRDVWWKICILVCCIACAFHQCH